MNSARSLPPSQFHRHFIARNAFLLGNFDCWLFRPGMLFGSLQKWWEEGGVRPHHHEGIDLHLYRDTAGVMRMLSGPVKIPAAYDGRVVKIIDDFLGKSIFVRHRIFSADDALQLCSVYGHTLPVNILQEGSEVTAGEVLATLPASYENKSKIPAHVHLTLVWLPKNFPDHQLYWQPIQHMALCDPLMILSDNYHILK